jgi:hypothetical protein
LNEPFEQQTSDKLTISQWLFGVLIITSLLIAIFYFDLGSDYSDDDELITLKVKASDVPEHVGSSKYRKTGYWLKTQEFNCRFWITEEAYDIVKNNSTRKERLLATQRGDDLRIVIHKSEEKDINRLYFNGTLAGLHTKDEVIFSPKEVRILHLHNRDRHLWVSSVVWLSILMLLIIARVTRGSQ